LRLYGLLRRAKARWLGACSSRSLDFPASGLEASCGTAASKAKMEASTRKPPQKSRTREAEDQPGGPEAQPPTIVIRAQPDARDMCSPREATRASTCTLTKRHRLFRKPLFCSGIAAASELSPGHLVASSSRSHRRRAPATELSPAVSPHSPRTASRMRSLDGHGPATRSCKRMVMVVGRWCASVRA
jgi:hypothetical protein